MGDDDGGIGLVWLVNGEERAFEPSPEHRPWLEESTSWGSAEGPADEARKLDDDAPPELVWL